MHRVLIGLGSVAAVMLAWFAVQMIAAEHGEVVVLHTRNGNGHLIDTRLWVVDRDGAPWLRAGNPESRWMRQIRKHPEVELERDGSRGRYRAVIEPDARGTINAMMLEKYGWAERYIGLFFPRDGSVPIRLEPRIEEES